MNFEYELGPLQRTFLALIPIGIILLYFLKLRRSAVEVPSTYLWRRTIEDLHVNSLWQRLRNSLLLLLQLLLLLLLIAACLGPGCPGEELTGDRFIFLVDQSASMSAKDAGESGDQMRLEVAMDRVRNMIDRMEPNDVGMIIATSNRSNVVQSYTKNKSLLKKKLSSIKPTNRSTNIEEALVAAIGLATPGRISSDVGDVAVADTLDAQLFVLSDGALGSNPEVTLGGNIETQFIPIGAVEPPKNLGIVQFSLSNPLDSDGKVFAFVQLWNFGLTEETISLSLYVDGELNDSKSGIAVRSRDKAGVSFDLSKLAANISEPIQLRVEIDVEDVFELDNVAYEVLNPPRKSNVLVVTESNRFLRLAMDTDRVRKLALVEFQPPAYLEDKKFEKKAALGAYDVILFDGCQPKTAPMCHAVYFNRLPPGEDWKFGDLQSPTTILDTSQSHPLMFGHSLNSVTVIDSKTVSGPTGTNGLVESVNGPIMAIGPRGSFEDLVIGFPIVEFDSDSVPTMNSDWPNQLGFPLFVQNIIVAMGNSVFETMEQKLPGEIVTVRTQLPRPKIDVVAPDSDTTSLKPRADNSFSFTGTEQTGIYKVVEPTSGDIEQMFAVNLLDKRESDLAVSDELTIGFSEFKGNRERKLPARFEFWPWLIGAALVVLLVEWYIYNRRVLV